MRMDDLEQAHAAKLARAGGSAALPQNGRAAGRRDGRDSDAEEGADNEVMDEESVDGDFDDGQPARKLEDVVMDLERRHTGFGAHILLKKRRSAAAGAGDGEGTCRAGA